MSTAQALAFAGVKFIKKKHWLVGKVYISDYDVRRAKTTWCFIHPTDVPDPKPTPVFLYMLTGDDWEEIKDAGDQQGANEVHGSGGRGSGQEERAVEVPGQGVHPGPDHERPAGAGEEEEVKKVSKASVNYRLSAGAKRCGNCAMLHGQTCDLVMGKIERTYVCDRWVKKK